MYFLNLKKWCFFCLLHCFILKCSTGSVCAGRCWLHSWRQLLETDLWAHSAVWRWPEWIQGITGSDFCFFFFFSLLMDLKNHSEPVNRTKKSHVEFKWIVEWSPVTDWVSPVGTSEVFFYLRSKKDESLALCHLVFLCVWAHGESLLHWYTKDNMVIKCYCKDQQWRIFIMYISDNIPVIWMIVRF